MIATVIKTFFQKRKLKMKNIREYKRFSAKEYRQEIQYKLSIMDNASEKASLKIIVRYM